MKCDIKIMGAPKRIENIEKIRQTIGLSINDIFLDDRPNGGHAMYTARKTWMLPFEDGVTHRCVLQDDVEVCGGFVNVIQRIVNKHPDCFICLYNPTNPDKYDKSFWVNDNPYIKVVGCDTWGQAIIIPRNIIPNIFEWVDSINPDYPHDDAAIAEYARLHKETMLLTKYSLVQHLCPTKSLLKYNNKNKVSKCYVGDLGINAESLNWESDDDMHIIKSICFMKVK